MSNTLLYQNGAFTVRPHTFGKTHGYAVYQDVGTHAVLVAQIGYPGDRGLQRAIEEADKRANAPPPAEPKKKSRPNSFQKKSAAWFKKRGKTPMLKRVNA